MTTLGAANGLKVVIMTGLSFQWMKWVMQQPI